MTDTGATPRANFREWRAHVIGRLANQIENSADRLLMNLFEKLKAYPVPPGSKPYRPSGQARLGDIAIPLKLTAALFGGHVGVGFENNLYLPDGLLAPDNASLVEAAAVALRDLALPLATGCELRETLRTLLYGGQRTIGDGVPSPGH